MSTKLLYEALDQSMCDLVLDENNGKIIGKKLILGSDNFSQLLPFLEFLTMQRL